MTIEQLKALPIEKLAADDVCSFFGRCGRNFPALPPRWPARRAAALPPG
jgi:hypothetical protein